MSELFPNVEGFVEHTNLIPNEIEYRKYQSQIAEKCVNTSTLTALPTGAGKTIIAVLVGAEVAKQHPDKTFLFLAPNQPLVEQQRKLFMELLNIPEEEFIELTGDVSPLDRSHIWHEESHQFVFATPQVIQNDILESRMDLTDISCVVYDECHKATGKYAYTFIGEEYQEANPDGLSLGLSASPGSSEDDVLDVCKSLGLKNVEIFHPEDDLIKDFVYTPDISQRWLDLDDEIQEMISLIDNMLQESLQELKDLDYLSTINPNEYDYRNAYQDIQEDIGSADNEIQSKGYSGISLYSEARKLDEALYRIETQSVSSFQSYLKQKQEEAEDSDASKAVKRMVSKDNFQKALSMAQNYSQLHPKKQELITVLAQGVMTGKKSIVFAQNKDTVSDLVSFINEDYDNMEARKLVGQSGMTQSEQKEVLDDFREDNFDILIATSVAEEGLDIPTAEIVVFMEPVSSPLRQIQRRGRTARGGEGTVYMFIANDTQDEQQYYRSKSKESSMKDELSTLSNKEDSIQQLLNDRHEQTGLGDFSSEDEPEESISTDTEGETTTASTEINEELDTEETEDKSIDTDTFDDDSDDISIIMDTREVSMNSVIGRKFYHMDDVDVTQEQLDVGDFIVGPDTGIERKTATDLLDTITGNRDIFEQLGDLANSYERAILILELENGIEELYSGGVPNNAVRGLLDSLAGSYGVELIPTTSEEDSAKWIRMIAKRAQDDSESTVQAHGNKSTKTLTDQQEYLVSAIADVGTVTAKLLLTEFDTAENVFTATEEELQETEGVGPKTAQKIKRVVTETYQPEEDSY